MTQTAFQHPQGGVGTISISPAMLDKLVAEGETPANARDLLDQDAIDRAGGDVNTYRIHVELNSLPSGTFRAAWILPNQATAVTLDYPLAGDVVRVWIQFIEKRAPTSEEDTEIDAAVAAEDEAALLTIHQRYTPPQILAYP